MISKAIRRRIMRLFLLHKNTYLPVLNSTNQFEKLENNES